MDYIVVTARTESEISSMVWYKIQDGWEPQGGIAISYVPHTSSGMVFSQALIKHEKQK